MAGDGGARAQEQGGEVQARPQAYGGPRQDGGGRLLGAGWRRSPGLAGPGVRGPGVGAGWRGAGPAVRYGRPGPAYRGPGWGYRGPGWAYRGPGWRGGPGWGPGVVGGALIGAILASSPAGFVAYPGYAEPLYAPDCYWAAQPVLDAWGQVVSYVGEPV